MLFTHTGRRHRGDLRGGRAVGNSRRERGLHADHREGSKSRGSEAVRMELSLRWVLKGFGRGKAWPACWWGNRPPVLVLGKEGKMPFAVCRSSEGGLPFRESKSRILSRFQARGRHIRNVRPKGQQCHKKGTYSWLFVGWKDCSRSPAHQPENHLDEIKHPPLPEQIWLLTQFLIPCS